MTRDKAQGRDMALAFVSYAFVSLRYTVMLVLMKSSGYSDRTDDYIGLPMPRPIGCCGPSWLLFGFLIVSSTERMRQAASVAAVNALIFTTAGSQTQHCMLSAMSSKFISTPYHCKPLWCFWRNLFRIFVASNPALSHSCL